MPKPDICLNTQELDEALKQVEARLEEMALEERRRKLEDFLAFEGFRSGQRYMHQCRHDEENDVYYTGVSGFRFFAMFHEQHVWFGQESIEQHWDSTIKDYIDEHDYTKPLPPPPDSGVIVR
jgi:hypothetical protein